MKNKIRLLILAIILISSFIYLSKDKSLDTVSLRLKWYHNAQFAGIYSAIEYDFYRDHGLEVNFLERDLKAGQVSTEVASGKVDFGITNSIDVIKAVDEGKKIKAIGVIYQKSPAAIASLKESNILSPQDLAGKKLGIQQDTIEARIFYTTLLNKYEVDPSSVEFVLIKNGITNALKTKEVDAVSTYRTNEVYNLKKSGLDFRIMRPEYYGFDLYDDVIITSDELIKNNPEKVSKFIQATIDGWIWTFENENGALEIISDYDHGDYDDISREAFILESSKPLISWDSVSKNIGRMEEKKWENLISNFYSSGIITKKLNTSDLYTDQFLKN